MNLEPRQRTNSTLEPGFNRDGGNKVWLPALGSAQPLLGSPYLTLPWTAPGLYQAVREVRADLSD